MTAATDTILGKKTAKGKPAKSRSSFSPAMLEQICAGLSGALSNLYGVKSLVVLDSVGVEPYRDLVDGLTEPASAAFVELNGTASAAAFCFDPALVFHTIDVLLGGDPDEAPTASERPPTRLDDKFSASLAKVVIGAFAGSCNETMGAGTVAAHSLTGIEHDRNEMELTQDKAEVLCVRTTVKIGQGERSGALEIHVPLTTVDMLSNAGGGAMPTMSFGGGPWFDHMRDSVLEMELETIGILHSEKMSVADISRLDIGTVIAVPGTAIEDMPIVLEDGGDVISGGELGSSSGKRIVRLSGPPNAAFLEPLRQVMME